MEQSELVEQASRVRIEVSRQAPLVDDPLGVVVSGCEPGSPVVVDAWVDVAGAVHAATATFDADDAGVVDTSSQSSQAGTYTGVDPFGLWWSGEPVGPSTAAPQDPLRCRLRVETSRGVTEAVLERRWLAAGATVSEVREPGVFGLFARPAGPGPFPGVIAFGGSSGGFGPAAAWAPMLASHGFATLAIAYFGAPSLPDALVNIEVETVERAIAWLLDRGDVGAETVAVMGMSRGSELAFLAGAVLDHVGAVVAFAPSGVCWPGLGPRGPVAAPAWTFRGQSLPYVARGTKPPDGIPSEGPFALRPLYERALEDKDAIRAAEIPVERTKGPILMVSGELDAMWPSTPMAEIAQRRAAESNFPHHVIHLRYADGGHLCAGVPGIPVGTEIRQHPLTGGSYSFGGSRAGNALARADSWPRVIEFIADALAGGQP
jgi:dienelactone hydrolase